MKQYRSYLYLLTCLTLWACGSALDSSDATHGLLKINEQQRKAHMTNDANLLVASMADSLITVDKGQVFISSREQVRERFEQYFQTVTYFLWDDTQAPLIEVSRDGSLATMSVQKKVVAESELQPRDTTIFAWTSAFRKSKNGWKMYSITSTND